MQFREDHPEKATKPLTSEAHLLKVANIYENMACRCLQPKPARSLLRPTRGH